MSESSLLTAVREKYGKESHVVLPQVRSGTGFSRSPRTADAIVLCVWPSLGIHAHGYEFKASRADWLRELRDFKKSDEIGRYCARWTIAAIDDSVVKLEEVPDAWGLAVVRGGVLVELKRPPLREVESPPWEFVAAVLRAAKAVVTDEKEVELRVRRETAKLSESHYVQLKEAVNRATVSERRRFDELQEKVRRFEAEAGISIERQGIRGIGKAVKFVMDGGVNGEVEKMRWMLTQCRELTSRLEGVIAEASLDNLSPKDA